MRMRTRIFGMAIGAVVLCLSLSSSPLKARLPQVRLSAIETYLNHLTTLKATFKQWDLNGAMTSGILQLRRPGFIRMSYNPPSHFLILANGKTIFFVDLKTRDISHAPIEQSPAAFLLESQIDFIKTFDIEKFEIENGQVKLTMHRKDAQDLGSLTLIFRRHPLLLVGWIVRDIHNAKTIVKLDHIQTGVSLQNTLFDISPYLSKE